MCVELLYCVQFRLLPFSYIVHGFACSPSLILCIVSPAPRVIIDHCSDFLLQGTTWVVFVAAHCFYIALIRTALGPQPTEKMAKKLFILLILL